MSNDDFIVLGSIDAARPVFLIIMGAFLAIVAWRLAKTAGAWTARALVTGALMLASGYGVVIPLYEAGVVHPHLPGATAQAWGVIKTTLLNAGWLLFGIGVAMHVKRFPSTPPHPRTSPHDSFVRSHSD